MNCNFLHKNIVRWFNDNLGKTEKDFTFRFRVKESLMYLKDFPMLIQMLILPILAIKLFWKGCTKFLFIPFTFANSCIFCKNIRFFSSWTGWNEKRSASPVSVYYLFDQNVTPSLWTLCNVVPFNTEQCFKSYKFGLGSNFMEGREQKHQKISKYAENTTIENRWTMIFWHEFIQ